jgi:hypothetical protein
MNKKALPILALSLIALSCGGGGGGSNGTNETSSSSSNKTVEGNIVASKVEGLKVCIKETKDCGYTDKNGHFVINTHQNLPVVIVPEIPYQEGNKTGNIVLGEYEMEMNNATITPTLLAGNNTELIEKIGAIIHGLAGDDTGDKDFISVKGVEITGIEDENGNPIELSRDISIKELIKDNQNIIFKFKNPLIGKEGKIKVGKNTELCIDNTCKGIDYKPYKWLVILILGTDNEVKSETGETIINKLGELKYSPKLKVVAITDYREEDGTYIYANRDENGRFEEVWESSQELNSGDKDTLLQLIETAIRKYPSKRIWLVIYSEGKPYKSVIIDESDGTELYINEFGDILKKIEQDIGKKIDALTLDVDYSGNIETLYSVAKYCDYITAKEEEDFDLEYDKLIDNLNKNLNMTAKDLSKNIIDDYNKFVSNGTEIGISGNDILNIVQNLNNFVSKVDWNNSTMVQEIINARKNSEAIQYKSSSFKVINIGGTGGKLIDLYSFITQFQNKFTEAKNIADIIKNAYKTNKNTSTGGLSIYFPLSKDEDDKEYYCSQQSPCGNYYNPFTETNWVEFIQNYLNKVEGNNSSS